MGAKPLEHCSLDEARAAMEQFKLMQLPVPADVTVEDTQFPIDGGTRTARIYRPAVEGPLPVIVFIHGGGWVGGSLGAFDEPCATLARNVSALVVSPDYRLAPEHPFPAATDDTVAVLRWAAEQIADHGGDQRSLLGLQRALRHLDGEFAPVIAQPHELVGNERGHGAGRAA